MLGRARVGLGRFDRFVTAIFSGFTEFAGFVSLAGGEASWSEYLRQFCFHDLGVVMYRCGLNFVKNVVLESESM